MWALRPCTPGVVATAADPQNPAHQLHRIVTRVVSHKLEFLLHCGIREKMPSAFLGSRVPDATARLRIASATAQQLHLAQPQQAPAWKGAPAHAATGAGFVD